jgi:hypothetical protein
LKDCGGFSRRGRGGSFRRGVSGSGWRGAYPVRLGRAEASVEGDGVCPVIACLVGPGERVMRGRGRRARGLAGTPRRYRWLWRTRQRGGCWCGCAGRRRAAPGRGCSARRLHRTGGRSPGTGLGPAEYHRPPGCGLAAAGRRRTRSASGRSRSVVTWLVTLVRTEVRKTSGAMGIRTPDLLHAMVQHAVQNGSPTFKVYAADLLIHSPESTVVQDDSPRTVTTLVTNFLRSLHLEHSDESQALAFAVGRPAHDGLGVRASISMRRVCHRASGRRAVQSGVLVASPARARQASPYRWRGSQRI